jgi:hypothetical protein
MSEPGAASKAIGVLTASLESAGMPVADVRTKVGALVKERPEVAVVGAFAGGLLAAMIVRRLGG